MLVQRACGCVVGSFVGDALGAYMEFVQKGIAKLLVKEALAMPGGGTFNLAPGQITDDT